MIDFNTLLNAAFDAAIEAKLAPLREQIKALTIDGMRSLTRIDAMGDLALVENIEKLVDIRIKHFLKKHNEDYDHDDFASEDDIRSKVNDVLDDVFASKFDAALDGTRVTLST